MQRSICEQYWRNSALRDRAELDRVCRVIYRAETGIERKGRDVHDWLAQVLQVLLLRAGVAEEQLSEAAYSLPSEIRSLGLAGGIKALAGRAETALKDQKLLVEQIAQLEKEKQAWVETAWRHLRNESYYRTLLVRIGLLFGDKAYISDDGSVQQDVLVAKVPELVEQELKTKERDLENERRAGDALQRQLDAAEFRLAESVKELEQKNLKLACDLEAARNVTSPPQLKQTQPAPESKWVRAPKYDHIHFPKHCWTNTSGKHEYRWFYKGIDPNQPCESV